MASWTFNTNYVAVTKAATTGSWYDVDISALVPVGTKGVILYIEKNSSSNLVFGVRDNGSTDSTYGAGGVLTDYHGCFAITGIDTNRIFEFYQSSNSFNVYIVAYSSVDNFFVNQVDKTPATLAYVPIYQDVDCSGTISASSSAALIRMYDSNTTATSEGTLLRRKGSSYTTNGNIRGTGVGWYVADVDASQVTNIKFSARQGDDSPYLKIHVLGQQTTECVMFSSPYTPSLPSAGSWGDVTVSSVVPIGATGVIVRIKNGGFSNYYGLSRAKGSTDDYSAKRKIEAANFFVYDYVKVDADRTFQFKRENTDISAEVMGYFKDKTVLTQLSTDSFTTSDSIVTENWHKEDSFSLSDSITAKISEYRVYLTDSLSLSDSAVGGEQLKEATRMVRSGNFLYLVTDQSPSLLWKVDITSTPTGISYALTLNHATDIHLDTTFNKLYISCENGKIIEIPTSDLTNQTIIDTSDTDELTNITKYDAYEKIYTSTDHATGELIKLDNSIIYKFNTDIRTRLYKQSVFSMFIHTRFGSYFNGDFRTRKAYDEIMVSDLRWRLSSQTYIKQEDWHVYINSIEITDVDLTSINVNIPMDEYSTCSFRIGRKCDSYFPINQSISVKIKTTEIFTGTVSGIKSTLTGEDLTISGRASSRNTSVNPNQTDLHITSTTEARDIYHIVDFSVEYSSPTIDPTDTKEIQYKGVKVHLGMAEYERIANVPISVSAYNLATGRARNIYTYEVKLFDESNPTSNPLPEVKTISSKASDDDIIDFGAEYFYFGSFTDIISGANYSNVYLGTSLSVTNGWTVKFTDLYRIEQVVYPNVSIDLGYYTLGTAPYLDISTSYSGMFIPRRKYEDKMDGIYTYFAPGYDYTEYVKKIAEREYRKLKNINGEIAVEDEFNATVSLTLDAYFYYALTLNSKINITNTTSSNLFVNQNGFPISIKTISLSSGSMLCTLSCDNNQSEAEQEAIDEEYGDEDNIGGYQIAGSLRRLKDKFNFIVDSNGYYIIR